MVAKTPHHHETLGAVRSIVFDSSDSHFFADNEWIERRSATFCAELVS